MSINCLLIIRQAMETLVHFNPVGEIQTCSLRVFCAFGVDDPELITAAV